MSARRQERKRTFQSSLFRDLETTPVQQHNNSWDFPSDGSGDHVTSLHPYPARFIPAIPRLAIESADLAEGSVVWDPFAGSGTTLIEANHAGHTAVGIDVNHLAHFLQRAYTTRLESADLEELRRLHGEALQLRTFSSLAEVLGRRAEIPRLTHWFSEGAILAIDAFLQLVGNLGSSEASKLSAHLALSRVLVRISRQESDTQYRAVKPGLARGRALKVIADSLREVTELLPYYQSRLSQAPVFSRVGDAREPEAYQGLPEPDLVVTSPPYPNAYEYWLYHKYRMFWLHMNPIWSRAREIGARPFYSGEGKLGPADFRRDIRRVLENITAHSKLTTRQVWIAGDGVAKGQVISTSQIVAEEAQRLGWRVQRRERRKLRRSRSSFQGIGRLQEEEVVTLGGLS